MFGRCVRGPRALPDEAATPADADGACPDVASTPGDASVVPTAAAMTFKASRRDMFCLPLIGILQSRKDVPGAGPASGPASAQGTPGFLLTASASNRMMAIIGRDLQRSSWRSGFIRRAAAAPPTHG